MQFQNPKIKLDRAHHPPKLFFVENLGGENWTVYKRNHKILFVLQIKEFHFSTPSLPRDENATNKEDNNSAVPW